jgi:hypothetical protein
MNKWLSREPVVDPVKGGADSYGWTTDGAGNPGEDGPGRILEIEPNRLLVHVGEPTTQVRRELELIGEIMRAYRIVVVEHSRPGGSRVTCPPPETTLEAGDGVMLEGKIETLRDLRERVEANLATPA